MLQADRSWKKNSFKDLQFLAAKKILLRFQLDREEVIAFKPFYPFDYIYILTQITLGFI